MRLLTRAHDGCPAGSQKIRRPKAPYLLVTLASALFVATSCGSDVNTTFTKTYDGQYLKTIGKVAILSVVYSDVLYYGGRTGTVTGALDPKNPEVLRLACEQAQQLVAYLGKPPLRVTLPSDGPESELYNNPALKDRDRSGVSPHGLGTSCLADYISLPENDVALYASLSKQLVGHPVNFCADIGTLKWPIKQRLELLSTAWLTVC